MKAIRKMEPTWEKICGRNFALTSRTIVQPNGGTREVPCYSLTKTECLYIATKFNDEAQCDRGLMKAIRKMEPAWEKICGRNFALTSRTIVLPNGGTREVPCYSLTKTECLYIATKFNDEARCDRGLMKAIRNMKPAWEKVNGGNFSLVEYRDKKGQLRPCYVGKWISQKNRNRSVCDSCL